MYPQPRKSHSRAPLGGWLTLDRYVAAGLLNLVYWAGLAVVAIIAFGAVGASIGIAMHDPFPEGLLLALPGLVIGLLVALALALIWRAFCEVLSAILSIAEDMRAWRESQTGGKD